MNVSLTPKLEALVQSKVKSGFYNNASEVIREALRFFLERDKMKAMKQELLRNELSKGLDSLDQGKGVNISIGNIAEQVLLDNQKQSSNAG